MGHPELGNYFVARLSARESGHPSVRSERADFCTLLKYGYMPQRVAFWIYWQALVLLWKGAPLFMNPPPESYKEAISAEMERKQKGRANFRSWEFDRVRWPFSTT